MCTPTAWRQPENKKDKIHVAYRVLVLKIVNYESVIATSFNTNEGVYLRKLHTVEHIKSKQISRLT